MTADDTSKRRRAVIRTHHETAADAKRVARSLAPDNTDEMQTVVDGETVVTTIERETTGGLHATVDDYVVNLDVAAQLSEHPLNTHDT